MLTFADDSKIKKESIIDSQHEDEEKEDIIFDLDQGNVPIAQTEFKRMDELNKIMKTNRRSFTGDSSIANSVNS